MTTLTANDIERFWKHVDIRGESECWDWVGSYGNSGYGHITVAGKTVDSHRLAYQIAKGDPTGKVVCHQCDNPKCCNPNHLWLGTQSQNMRDMVAKGRAKFQNNQPSFLSPEFNAELVPTLEELTAPGGLITFLHKTVVAVMQDRVAPAKVKSICSLVKEINNLQDNQDINDQASAIDRLARELLTRQTTLTPAEIEGVIASVKQAIGEQE